jgi:hypothetical protein
MKAVLAIRNQTPIAIMNSLFIMKHWLLKKEDSMMTLNCLQASLRWK